MDVRKDYYSVLGVSPTADIIIIKAAYKALAKIFHPDKFEGSTADAHIKMLVLNEAYEVLSNRAKRKEYDGERANNSYKNQAKEDTEQQKTVNESLKSDWDIACRYKPSLIGIYSNLHQISPKLSFSFQVLILESKNFDKASDIATEMQIKYLDNYFGPNKTIMEFARKLIVDGQIKAAKELNRVIKIFGESADAESIISKIERDYALYSFSEKEKLKSNERIIKERKEYLEMKGSFNRNFYIFAIAMILLTAFVFVV